MTFNELLTTWDWQPIRNCPGRYILPTGAGDNLTPLEVLRSESKVTVYQVAAARDLVLIAHLDEGGLISYQRADGCYIHTLNTAEGFARKLSQLGIELSE
jgi:hypothetical protein